jgi:hypothetical protein
MFTVTVTYKNYVVPNSDSPAKIIAFVKTLQDAGKTDGAAIRYNSGENGEDWVIEREFVDLDSAQQFVDFIDFIAVEHPGGQEAVIREVTP